MMREMEGTAREILVACCPLDDDGAVTLSSCRDCEYFNAEFSDKITCLHDGEQDEGYCGDAEDMHHRDLCAQEDPFDFE
jgi:hypothetical protein